MLGRVATSVLGVDVDGPSVEHATLRYATDTVSFVVGSMTDQDLDVDDASIDLVVCFEALEHVVEHDALFKLVARVLAPGGIFVVSTPDVAVYSHQHGNENPFHVRELSEPEFVEWLSPYAHLRIYRQNVVAGSVLAAADLVGPGELLTLEPSGADSWAVRRGAPHTYLVAVASDAELPQLPSTSTLVDPGLEIVAARQRAQHDAESRMDQLAAGLAAAEGSAQDAEDRVLHLASEVAALHATASTVQVDLQNARAAVDAEREAATRARLELADMRSSLAEQRRRTEQAERELISDRTLSTARLKWLGELRGDAETAASRLLPLATQADVWNRSDTARIVTRYRRAVEELAPPGTRRRRSYQRLRGLPEVVAPESGSHGPVSLHTSAEPVVTIVIPVHGKWDFTRRCLESIEAARSDVPFEVVVVDDASPDDTADRVAACPGVRLVRAPRNLGFVGACNLGAKSVRSALTVFLNNDTEVTHGWLDALVDAAHGDPRVGLVGAKLVNPDGTLQECGGIIWRDGSGWNYGRGGPASGPLVDVRRRVDYCSGAAVLVRTELFRDLGGFDQRYSPAYYEDTDLAFGIRSLGYHTIVEPTAVVVHHEGVSHGKDTSSGVKRFQELNRLTFAAKWVDELEHRPLAASPGAVWRWRQHAPRGLVMVVDHAVPRPDHDSGSVRMAKILELLVELGYGVVFLPFNGDAPEPYTSHLGRKGVTVLSDPGRQQQFLAEAADHLSLAFLSRHHVAYRYLEHLRKHAPQCRIVYDTVDLHHVRLLRQAELEADASPVQGALRREAATMRELEVSLTRIVDTTLVVSEMEREVLLEAVPGADIRVLSNVHDPRPGAPDPGARSRILFVGSFDHPPNRDAVEWMCHAVMPIVRQRVPGSVLTVVGSNPPAGLADELGEAADFRGWVEDLDPYYQAARVVVAPLRFGAGVKGKVGESVARGVPTVVTPVGLEGMHLRPEVEVLVAESAEDFAGAVVRLLFDDDVWRTLAINGPDAIARQFSSVVAAKTLATLVPAAPNHSVVGGDKAS
jgi:GT2 family glycosyltransferase/glycosyltransferase involved in cell wall biosynthesis